MTRLALALAALLCAGAAMADDRPVISGNVFSGTGAVEICLGECPPFSKTATCWDTDGVRWPARVMPDGSEVCFSSDRPTWYQRFGAWLRGVAGMKKGDR